MTAAGSTAASPPFSRVAIAGVGVIGGSIGFAIRRAWPFVHRIGVDSDSVLDEALRRGAIDEGRSSVRDLKDADLIVLATPVRQITNQIQEIATSGYTGLVTDVGSTKRAIVTAAAAAGLHAFVGGHPMAGAAGAGLIHARADLFDGRVWLLVGEKASPNILTVFVSALGARPHVTHDITHDRVMVYVSHAPQLLSSALAAAARDAVGEAGLAFSGPGFADMTRLAASAASVWRDILATNADFIHEALRTIASTLPADARALADGAVVDRLFDRANAARALVDVRS